MNASGPVQLSIVIPVFNEELNLPTLFARLYPVLDGLGRRYEILFTNDGSHDRSIELLRAQQICEGAILAQLLQRLDDKQQPALNEVRLLGDQPLAVCLLAEDLH